MSIWVNRPVPILFFLFNSTAIVFNCSNFFFTSSGVGNSGTINCGFSGINFSIFPLIFPKSLFNCPNTLIAFPKFFLYISSTANKFFFPSEDTLPISAIRAFISPILVSNRAMNCSIFSLLPKAIVVSASLFIFCISAISSLSSLSIRAI